MNVPSLIKSDYKGKYDGAEIRRLNRKERHEISVCPNCKSKKNLRVIYTFLGSDYRQVACTECKIFTNLFNVFASHSPIKAWNREEIFVDAE